MNIVVVALLVFIGHIIFNKLKLSLSVQLGQAEQLWSINVNLRLLMATIEFLWWVGGGGACTVLFMSKPTTALKLCCGCVVLSLGF